MRTVFLGTPEAAVPTLEALDRISTVAGVVTMPDRPRGRSGTPAPSPVKERAIGLGLPVLQPSSSAEVHDAITAVGPVDVAVLVAYGMLIRAETLALPAAGFVNVHFSLLPRWRGAAPVHRAILAGDGRTGVTLIQLDEGLDTGPILTSWATEIGPRETTGSLTARLARIGALSLDRALPSLAGRAVAVPQDDGSATTAAKIDRDERWIEVGAPVEVVLRTIRALDPSPGAWARHGSGRLRIHQAQRAERRLPVGALDFDGTSLSLGVGDGSIVLVRVQPEGKRPMPGPDWARGRSGDLGELA